MRDIGALLWVAIVVLGVVSSIVSSARKQQAARAPVFRPPPQPMRPAVPLAASRPPAPATPAAPASARAAQAPRAPARVADAPVVSPAAPVTHHPAMRARALFGRRRALVRAIVAAEVLGKPRALGDEV